MNRAQRRYIKKRKGRVDISGPSEPPSISNLQRRLNTNYAKCAGCLKSGGTFIAVLNEKTGKKDYVHRECMDRYLMRKSGLVDMEEEKEENKVTLPPDFWLPE